ncbi:Uncharacterised protein [uncultured archaeon]|nr:Uncharacterised protein [uncultured archaeon]
MRTKKAALQISFGWLFAIIVGAVILFLAIFAATKILDTGNTQSDTQIAKQILILLNPLESSFSTDTATHFDVPADTRLYNSCTSEEGFGKQKIRVSQQTFGKWSTEGLNVSFENKYIFSTDPLQGKRFYLFSKPLEMPFKVADLIYMTSDSKDYCFEDMPDGEQKDALRSLNESNPKLVLTNCSPESIKICFGASTDCDINVNEVGQYVNKNGTRMYFTSDSLMMAAIFSDPTLYECQIVRLMQRTAQIARLYEDKESIIKATGCDSNLAPDLNQLSTFAKKAKDSGDLKGIQLIADDINEKNSNTICRLW